MEAHSIGLEKALAELTERANRGHRAYLCYQGIPEADAEREANRVFPGLANPMMCGEGRAAGQHKPEA